MLAIWKWELNGGRTEIVMPKGSNILTVQMQRDSPCVWAMVDPKEKETEIKTFTIVGTGHQIPWEAGWYLGTFQILDGPLVFHAFVAE